MTIARLVAVWNASTNGSEAFYGHADRLCLGEAIIWGKSFELSGMKRTFPVCVTGLFEQDYLNCVNDGPAGRLGCCQHDRAVVSDVVVINVAINEAVICESVMLHLTVTGSVSGNYGGRDC